jgi:hypothetical protein
LNRQLNQVLLLVWGIWFSIVALTNALDGLKALQLLPAGFTFASGNWAFLKQVVAVHHTPTALAAGMFAGVIAWEGFAAVSFLRAWNRYRGDHADAGTMAARAFTVSAALWGAMMIASEIFISYGVEATHTHLLIATLVSFLVVARRP